MAKRKSKAQGIRISYNAPVTLTFSLLATAVLLLEQFVVPGVTSLVFTAPGRAGSDFAFNWRSVFDYIRLFTHVLGHAGWEHLIGNLSFILLLGPLLEERYGSGMLALMMAVTALVTGVLNVCFVPSGLLGASGIAFMMILLSSFTTITRNQIPLTFILIVVLYMGREIVSGLREDDISSFAHIAGGLCGSLFGFLGVSSARKTASGAKASAAAQKDDRAAVPAKKFPKPPRRADAPARSSPKGDEDSTVVISSAKF